MRTNYLIKKISTKKLAHKGFTLIEIMIVIAIIAMLDALIVPNLFSRQDQATKVVIKQDISTLTTALQTYRLDNSNYPTTEQGLQALITKPTIAPIPRSWQDKGYINKLPNDPWGRPYQYLSPGLHSEFDVFTFGKDREAGGDEMNADIGNWQ